MQKINMALPEIKDHRVSESYKVIRSNLLFLGEDKKVIMITSTVMNEGKSTVSLNLAVSLAESDKKILYIDADMRKSVFIGRNNVRTRTLGLSHFLTGQVELEDIIYESPNDNLFIMPSGKFPPNPSELLSRKIFVDMINALREDFDYIVIDTPPISSAIDAAIISGACDGSIMVIGNKRLASRVIKDSVEQLKRSGKPVLGTILNMADFKDYPSYGKYYGYYYYSYKKDGGDEE